MKLSEKFARQESEDARLARIGRRRISKAQAESVRRFLGDRAKRSPARTRAPRESNNGPLLCDDCGRRFQLPMHLGRHRKQVHNGAPHPAAADNGAPSDAAPRDGAPDA